MASNKDLNRRDFIKRAAGAAGLLALASAPLATLVRQGVAAGAADSVSQNQDDHPRKGKHAWCMVIDLKKCEGCVTIGSPPQCTQACINGHYVPAGQQWIQVYEVRPEEGGAHFMPTPCMQCENSPCTNVCPVGATYHNEDGIVLIDHNRCIGCRFCMAACPYQRRFFNWGTPELPPEAALVEYSPEFPVPARKGTVIKCMFCAHRLRDGKMPHCITGCPMKALYIGDLNADLATNGQEAVELKKFLVDNDAYRYKAELGTQPRVWYLPGHGQRFGRKGDDSRELKSAEWSYGGGGFDRRPGVWPWGEEK